MIKINSLELENVKRIRAVQLEPTKNGLTIIGGNNEQGKTSVLDSIAWALGGNRYKPTNPKNDESMVDPYLKIELSNGLIVERKGKNSDLKIVDPSGQRAGQTLLDSFISTFALDLPKFMEQTNLEKGRTLLALVGLEEELAVLEESESKLYNERYEIGRIKERKEKYADELIEHEDVPKEKVSAVELINQQQEILARNGENQKKRENLTEITKEKNRVFESIEPIENKIESLKKRIEELELKKDNNIKRYEELIKDEEIAFKTVKELHDESTEEIVKSIENIEEINKKIDDNLNKERALSEAKEYEAEYKELTEQLEEVRKNKRNLLQSADLPLEGLSVEDGELTYKGQKWDGMSGSQRLRVATAISKALSPDCGFVLMDKLEGFDLEQLKSFGEYLEKEGLQVIATRVSTGDECQVIIEDGRVAVNKIKENKEEPQAKTWEKGVF